VLINDKLSQKYFNVFYAIFSYAYLRILPLKIKHVLYVRSHYDQDRVTGDDQGMTNDGIQMLLNVNYFCWVEVRIIADIGAMETSRPP